MARFQLGTALCLALWWSGRVTSTQIHHNPVECAVSIPFVQRCELRGV